MLTLRATFKSPVSFRGGNHNFAFVNLLTIIFGFVLDAYFPKLKGSSVLELTWNSAFHLTVPQRSMKLETKPNAVKDT